MHIFHRSPVFREHTSSVVRGDCRLCRMTFFFDVTLALVRCTGPAHANHRWLCEIHCRPSGVQASADGKFPHSGASTRALTRYLTAQTRRRLVGVFCCQWLTTTLSNSPISGCFTSVRCLVPSRVTSDPGLDCFMFRLSEMLLTTHASGPSWLGPRRM